MPTKDKSRDMQETVMWAYGTIHHKRMFGMDEKQAQFARDNRVKGVLIETADYIGTLQKEINRLRGDDNETTKA